MIPLIQKWEPPSPRPVAENEFCLWSETNQRWYDTDGFTEYHTNFDGTDCECQASLGLTPATNPTPLIMITLIRPILFSFLNSEKVKRLIVDLLKKLAEQSDNTVDDEAVKFIERGLFGGQRGVTHPFCLVYFFQKRLSCLKRCWRCLVRSCLVTSPL